MTFLKIFKPLFRFLFIFGLSPISVNKSNTKVITNYYHIIYVLLIYVSFLSVFQFSSYYGYFQYEFSKVFHNTVTLSGFVRVTLSINMYQLMLIFIILRRNFTEQFFNLLQSFDNKLYIKMYSVIDNKKCYHQNVIEHTIIIFIFIITELFAYKQNYFASNIYELIFHYCFTWMQISFTILITHIKNCGKMLILRFLCLRKRLQIEFYSDVLLKNNSNVTLTSTIKNIEIIMDLITDLWNIKNIMNNAFGFILLLNTTTDLVLISIGVYYFLITVLQQTTIISTFYNIFWFSLYLFPSIIKEFNLIPTLHTLSKQVKKYYKIYNKNIYYLHIFNLYNYDVSLSSLPLNFLLIFYFG